MSPSPTDDEKDEIFLACRYGDIDDVKEFISKYNTQLLADLRDENKNSVLHMICANGHLDLLKHLLPLLPPSALSAQNSPGSTPLHWAATNSQLEIAKALVQHPNGPGIDLIDIKNEAGHSPLADAELAGWDEGAKWFVEVMNLDTEGSKEGPASEDDDVPLDPEVARDIEVEIEDADGQIARMKISGSSGTVVDTPAPKTSDP
ncbi:ankyrin repeat-containing domain protein [Panaeolus papilionaceus]|nr:ankyrin repeat-containing domain protein [Panaeolus papilionaceus]